MEGLRILESLPNEIAMFILSWLSVRQLLRLRQVNRIWLESCCDSITTVRVGSVNDTILRSDEIPINFLSYLTQLEKLEFRKARRAAIAETDLIEQHLLPLTRLSCFSISNGISLDAWSRLSCLTRLCCRYDIKFVSESRTKLYYMPPASLLSSMKQLRIFEHQPDYHSLCSDGKITNLHLPTTLTGLSLSNCRYVITDSALQPLVQLRSLALANVKGLTNAGLVSLTNLTELDLNSIGGSRPRDSPGVSSDILTSLTKLVYLNFSYPALRDMRSLARLVQSLCFLHRLIIKLVDAETDVVISEAVHDIHPVFGYLWKKTIRTKYIKTNSRVIYKFDSDST